MKKIIIGLSGLVVLAFLTVLVVNAQDKDKKGTKAKSEVTHDCSKCPSAATCASSTSAPEAAVAPDDTTKCKAKCDPAKCKEGKCDPAKCKEGKCDPATCKKECKSAQTGMKCDTTKCSMHKADVK
jgi:hypothetical protein